MDGKSYVFAGNRFYVLEEMLRAELDVARILAVNGSYLQRVLDEKGIEHTLIEGKKHLVGVLQETPFDYFLANGCPFILPISKLADGHKVFLNIHPSPLPDLRGADPVPGALLHRRASGATCHLMDDGIDTGPIVARVIVPHTDDLDCGLLYQISFMAEKEVFRRALAVGFEPQLENRDPGDSIYYTRKDEHLEIDFAQPSEQTVARVKAFSTRSQGARFTHAGELFRVLDAEVVGNPFLLERTSGYAENEVVFNYESCLLLRKGEAYLKLKNIDGDLSRIAVGDVLSSGNDQD